MQIHKKAYGIYRYQKVDFKETRIARDKEGHF